MSSPKTIALLTDGVAPYVMGGMAMHSFNLARYLAQKGIHVQLFHFNASDRDIHALSNFSLEEKKNITPVVLSFPELGRLPGHYIRASLEYSRRIFEAFQQLPEPDFVYAQGFCAWYMLRQKARGRKLPPIGVNFHGLEMFQPAPDFSSVLKNFVLLRRPVRENLRRADFVFSFPGKIHQIHRKLGIPEEKLIVLPIGVGQEWLDLPHPNPVGRPRKFGFVGRFERRKGVEELNKVLRESPPDGNWEFHFIGPVPREKQLMEPGIHYHGPITEGEKLRSLVRQLDVLVVPSWSEGMPNVILEAFSAGVAVIATDVGAVNFLVDESRGWLIPPGNGLALKNGMKAARELSAADLLAKKENAQRFAQENLGWNRIIERLLGALPS